MAQAEKLVDERGVQFAIDQTALRIAVELRESDPIVMCVMHGGLPYTAELLKRFGFPLELSYVHVGRYHSGIRGGILNWYAKPKIDLTANIMRFID